MIDSVYINNFKSLVDFRLEKPNPFTVFIGPNASGKTNVFEALESLNLFYVLGDKKNTKNLILENIDDLINWNNPEKLELHIGLFDCDFELSINKKNNEFNVIDETLNSDNAESFFLENFNRLFINNNSIDKINIQSNKRLLPSAKNLELVLSRLLQDEKIKEEITDWLSLLIPEFEDLIIEKSGLSGNLNFYIKEKYTESPFPKHLLSDGTYNILAILTAVFQNEESPQFLCIDEPENGLNPKVIKELLNLFRQRCEENGDYIWINSHNPYLLKHLKPEEVVVIEKENGISKATQIKEVDLSGLSLEEAYFTNTIGGLPW